MTVAHIAGVPVEEVALSFTTAGITALIAIRACLQARVASLRGSEHPCAAASIATSRGDQAPRSPAAGHDPRTASTGRGSSFSSEFTFAPRRDGAMLVTMARSGFPSDELRDEHGRGVAHAFDRLERAL